MQTVFNMEKFNANLTKKKKIFCYLKVDFLKFLKMHFVDSYNGEWCITLPVNLATCKPVTSYASHWQTRTSDGKINNNNNTILFLLYKNIFLHFLTHYTNKLIYLLFY